MKIYFDVCCINRPFDDQSQPKIHLEAEAVLSILENIDNKQYSLVSSDVVIIEIRKTIDPERRERLTSINNKAQKYITVTEGILDRTKILKLWVLQHMMQCILLVRRRRRLIYFFQQMINYSKLVQKI